MGTWFVMGDTNLATNPTDVQRSEEHRLCSERNAAEVTSEQGECIKSVKGVTEP